MIYTPPLFFFVIYIFFCVWNSPSYCIQVPTEYGAFEKNRSFITGAKRRTFSYQSSTFLCWCWCNDNGALHKSFRFISQLLLSFVTSPITDRIKYSQEIIGEGEKLCKMFVSFLFVEIIERCCVNIGFFSKKSRSHTQTKIYTISVPKQWLISPTSDSKGSHQFVWPFSMSTHFRVLVLLLF